MYISRKRKNAYTTIAADNSAQTTLTPGNSEEDTAQTTLATNNSAYTPLTPNNSEDDSAYTAFTADNSGNEKLAFPEASVELINGEGSDLGRAPSSAELTYEEFLAANPQTGALRVQAYIGAQGFPVSGALVTVSAPFKDGERVLYAVKTNADGIADNLILPAPDREASQIPGSQNPFAEYNVSVSHPDYRTATFTGVPVFAGVRSIQPVVFLPRGTEE